MTPTYELSLYESLDDETLIERIQKVRAKLGSRLLILGHHYQRDSVIAMADLRGDSYKLSALAAENTDCESIVFCGVHFMAETADILANRPERLAQRDGRRVAVVLPDRSAGCSLADMAAINQVEDCWSQLAELIDIEDVTPITYVNSTAELKAFCGRHGGIVCTSANAAAVLRWAFERRSRVLFFPDQHLGRNTARAMGIPTEQMPLWDPDQAELGGNTQTAIRNGRVILWRGHCSVHQVFLPEHVEQFRREYPDIKVIVHPECTAEVVKLSDAAGSTGAILDAVQSAAPGTRWAVGTEQHMVDRLRRDHPEQHIHFLAPTDSICETMSRITLANVCWSIENLAAGTPVNVIEVAPKTARWSLDSLRRMLDVK